MRCIAILAKWYAEAIQWFDRFVANHRHNE